MHQRARRVAIAILLVLCALLVAGFAVAPAKGADAEPLELEISFPNDADGVVQPGSTLVVKVALTLRVHPSFLDDDWEGVIAPTLQLTTDASNPFTNAVSITDSRINAGSSWLRLSGGLSYQLVGSESSSVFRFVGSGSSATGGQLTCPRGAASQGPDPAIAECVITSTNDLAEIGSLGSLGEFEGHSLPRIRIPPGTEPGTYTISARLTAAQSSHRFLGRFLAAECLANVDLCAEVGAHSYSAVATFRVGETSGVQSVGLALSDREPTEDNDATTFPAAIRAGGSTFTELTLSVLGEDRVPAEASDIAGIRITATEGTLDYRGCEEFGRRPRSSTCTMTATAIAGLAGGATAAIDGLRLYSGAQAVESSVIATIDRVGGSLLSSDPVRVTFSGDVSRLVIDRPTSTLYQDGSGDGRDILSLTLRGVDPTGRDVGVPTVQLSVTDAAGRLVPSWRLAAEQDGDRIDLEVFEELDLGAYIVHAREGEITAQRAFVVSGRPALIALTLQQTGRLNPGDRVRVQGRVVDQLGADVADGTLLQLSIGSIPASADAVLISGQGTSRIVTEDGRFEASFFAIRRGRALITARADAATARLDISTTSARPAGPGIDSLSQQTPGDFASWRSIRRGRASELFADLASRGVASLMLWSGDHWFIYSEHDGTPTPGSVDFQIESGDQLYLGG